MASSYDRRSGSSGSSRGRDGRPRVSRAPGMQASRPVLRQPGGTHEHGQRRQPRAAGAARGVALPREEGVGARIARSKQVERELRRRQRRRKNQIRALAVSALIVLSALGARALYRSSVFEIRSVEVVGVQHLSREAVIEKAALPEGATLLRFPKAAISDRIAADPWVAEVHVTRDFPHTLRIRIVERVPFARVDTGQAVIWLVDANGVVLGEDSAETSVAVPVVRDVPGLDCKPGRQSTSEVLHNALRVLAGISPELYSQVRAVSAPSIDETALVTTSNVELMFGEAVDLARKDAVARRIMQEQGAAVVFIDVRNPDRPVSRGLTE